MLQDGLLDLGPAINVLHRVLHENRPCLPRDLRTSFGIVSGKDYLSAFFAETINCGTPYAIGTTGNKSDFSLESVGHCCLLRISLWRDGWGVSESIKVR
jgi:hypothetical protein